MSIYTKLQLANDQTARKPKLKLLRRLHTASRMLENAKRRLCKDARQSLSTNQFLADDYIDKAIAFNAHKTVFHLDNRSSLLRNPAYIFGAVVLIFIVVSAITYRTTKQDMWANFYIYANIGFFSTTSIYILVQFIRFVVVLKLRSSRRRYKQSRCNSDIAKVLQQNVATGVLEAIKLIESENLKTFYVLSSFAPITGILSQSFFPSLSTYFQAGATVLDRAHSLLIVTILEVCYMGLFFNVQRARRKSRIVTIGLTKPVNQRTGA